MSTAKQKREPNYRTLAKRHFPKAYRIEGEGPYAVATACRPKVVIVSLHATVEAAQETLAWLSHNRCGGRCDPRKRHLWHRLIDVRGKVELWPPKGHGNPRGLLRVTTYIPEEGGVKVTVMRGEEWVNKESQNKRTDKSVEQ